MSRNLSIFVLAFMLVFGAYADEPRLHLNTYKFGKRRVSLDSAMVPKEERYKPKLEIRYTKPGIDNPISSQDPAFVRLINQDGKLLTAQFVEAVNNYIEIGYNVYAKRFNEIREVFFNENVLRVQSNISTLALALKLLEETQGDDIRLILNIEHNEQGELRRNLSIEILDKKGKVKRSFDNVVYMSLSQRPSAGDFHNTLIQSLKSLRTDDQWKRLKAEQGQKERLKRELWIKKEFDAAMGQLNGLKNN